MPDAPNLQIEPPGGEADPIVKIFQPQHGTPTPTEDHVDAPIIDNSSSDKESQFATFSPDNLIGRTFLLPQQEDGQ